MKPRKYKQEKQRLYYDKGARCLPDANPGDPVQAIWNTWRRNRRSFRKIKESDFHVGQDTLKIS